ncbi:MAG: tRNA (adenosine(37)-N6)-dimethylallyltransferase MiaA [Prevotella sp.]|nr:tRNA (adenosine(37)-N6)-dimethylallyltransferase MiaA [Prevotella sp.]
MNNKKLIVLLGPTGVGKTNLSIRLAELLHCPIISSDSRQLYKGLIIGTAAPAPEQLARVKHYMVGTIEPEEYYSASEFEQDCLKLIGEISSEHILLSGGSMMYIDAICKGIDDMPTIDAGLRDEVRRLYENDGLDAVRDRLKLLDPLFYNQVDLKNPKRVIHALEVCLMTGKPYSSLRSNSAKKRDFSILKIGLTRDREELYQRINSRTDEMMTAGFLEEAKRFYPKRSLNSLNTVGYKEIFNYFDGQWDLDFAIEKIKQNTRIYSRKQMTWFKRDKDIHWFNLTHNTDNEVITGIMQLINNLL